MTSFTDTGNTAGDVTMDLLARMSQAEMDALYQKSPAGPIPVGETRGTVYFFPGSLFGKITRPIVRLLFWRGKDFNSKEGTLINRILPFRLRAFRAKVYNDPSWIDGKETIVLDYSKTSILKILRDEIREVAPGIYLGKVFWGRTRLMDFVLTTPRGRAR